MSSEAVQHRTTGFEAPPVTRVRPARWRSPQLIIGVLLVLASVVVGVRVVAAADDTVPVLVAARDLSPGQPLTPGMVETRQVALEGGYSQYVTGDVGDGYVVVRDVQAGELLAQSAIAKSDDVSSGAGALRLVTVAVPSAEVPAGLTTGDAVDVWTTPANDDGSAQRLAAGLTVTAIDTGGALGMNGNQATVTLAARADGTDALDELVGRLIAASRAGQVYLSMIPGGAV